jgi:hypothetical protein
MSLAYVQAVVAIFVAMMVSLTGLLTATAVLLPVHTRKAEGALERSPKRCLVGGISLLLIFAVGMGLLGNPFPILKLIGFLLISGLASLLTLGGAGMAQLMGRRISEMSGAKTTFGALVRGSIAYSVGVFFPYIGWFVLAPLSILCALGAGVVALWPSPNPNAVPVTLGWQPQPAFAGGPMMNAPINPTVHQTVHAAPETPQMASYNYGANAPVPPAAMPQHEEHRQG